MEKALEWRFYLERGFSSYDVECWLLVGKVSGPESHSRHFLKWGLLNVLVVGSTAL